MSVRSSRVVLVLVLVLVLVAVAATVAAPAAEASCAGPSISYDATEVAPGDVIRLSGEGLGDNCYDTGPPPDGQGALGNPAQDIEIVFVQAGGEIVVARGAADDDYGFAVDLAVPDAAEAGPASLRVRRWSVQPSDLPLPPLLEPPPTLDVVGASAVPPRTRSIVYFEGNAVVDRTTALANMDGTRAVEPSSTDRPRWTIAIAIGGSALFGLLALAAAAMVIQRRRLQRSFDTSG